MRWAGSALSYPPGLSPGSNCGYRCVHPVRRGHGLFAGVVRGPQFDSRQLPDHRENKPVVATARPQLEQQQSFVPARRSLSFTRYWFTFHFAKSSLRPKFRFACCYNQSRDLRIIFQHETDTSPTGVNTFRFQFSRRGVHFGFSQLPGGDQIGVNIPGVAYFGREPYSTVDRIERRYEFTDTLAKSWRNHTFKFGVDANVVQLRSAKAQIFELDFGGDVNFGGISAATFGFPSALQLPGATDLQAYGLGIP